jgi:hypothetical protein
LKNNTKIKDCRISEELLMETLIRLNMINYPFLIQSLFQNCYEHFKDHDDLKKHLAKKHNIGQFELNNYEVYAIMLIFNNQKKIYVKRNTKKVC